LLSKKKNAPEGHIHAATFSDINQNQFPPKQDFEKTLYMGLYFWLFLSFPLISTSNLHMGNLKKKRRLKMNNHKRRKRLKSNRHKKRSW